MFRSSAHFFVKNAIKVDNQLLKSTDKLKIVRFNDNLMHLEELQRAPDQAEGNYACSNGDYKCGQCSFCHYHIHQNKRELNLEQCLPIQRFIN